MNDTKVGKEKFLDGELWKKAGTALTSFFSSTDANKDKEKKHSMGDPSKGIKIVQGAGDGDDIKNKGVREAPSVS